MDLNFGFLANPDEVIDLAGRDCATQLGVNDLVFSISSLSPLLPHLTEVTI